MDRTSAPPPGTDPNLPTYVAIKGRIFDVSGNAAYAPKGQYHGTPNPLSSSLPLLTPLSLLSHLPPVPTEVKGIHSKQ